MSRLFQKIILELNPKVKILSISSNELILKFTNISQALLRHDILMKRRKLLLYVTFNFFKAVLVQSNHIGTQCNVEQYITFYTNRAKRKLSQK